MHSCRMARTRRRRPLQARLALAGKKLMRPIQKVFAIPIEVVFFDIGETLIDETRLWAGWAAHLGVSSNEFLHVPHETIERGR